MSSKHRIRQAEAFVGRQQQAEAVDLFVWFNAIKYSFSPEQDREVAELARRDPQAAQLRTLEIGAETNPHAYEVIVAELQRRRDAALAG